MGSGKGEKREREGGEVPFTYSLVGACASLSDEREESTTSFFPVVVAIFKSPLVALNSM
jgi:hypothetical protein